MNRAEAKKKAQALVAQMDVMEAAAQLSYDAPAIDRLNIPEYNWWNEALHGVARAGVATSFPQAIGIAATFDPELVQQLANGMNNAADAMSTSLAESTEALLKSMDGFNATVESFNQGVRDFSEFDYNLRGTVERLDLAVRELSGAIRRVTRGPERSDKQ